MTFQRPDLLEELTRPFDETSFSRGRTPTVVGMVALKPAPTQRLESIFDMLVKLPGEEIAIPEPYASDRIISHFLALALAAEDKILPNWRENYYLYLTVDHRAVPTGSTHRNEGWHFDDMQGARYPDKLPICHQYVMSDALPTEYLTRGVDMTGLSEEDENWFAAIDERAGIISKHDITTFGRGTVVLMTVYQIHRAVMAEEPTLRLFLRLDVSLKQQDRAGNSINPLLPPPWPMVTRRFDAHAPVQDAGWPKIV